MSYHGYIIICYGDSHMIYEGGGGDYLINLHPDMFAWKQTWYSPYFKMHAYHQSPDVFYSGKFESNLSRYLSNSNGCS